MSWLDQVGGLLRQYSGGQGAQDSQNVEQHYDEVARAAPHSAVADALSAAFRSDQTPSFGQMAGQLFGASNGQQQASVLNTLIQAAGPTVLSSMMAGGALPALSSILGRQARQITPQEAAQIPPQELQQIAEHAEKHNPSIVDQVSQVYAHTPGVVKVLGGTALTIALGRIAGHIAGRG